ncbi:aminotransferase class III-fold pyridoxal phosphate-dependent enzyme, partial [Vibrio parahaemolyticus]
GHPGLKAALKAQMDDLPFTPRRFTSEPAVLLAEKLAAISPGDLSKVLFATGGSDAIDMALKLARAATGRHKTLSFWDSFHG